MIIILEVFYKTLDNSSVSAIIAVLLAAIIARHEYRKQKDQDRDSSVKLDLINEILLLQEKAHYGLLVIDRIANSWIITTATEKEFLKESLQNETPKLSNVINEDIPSLLMKISSKINIYFDNDKINTDLKLFIAELKKMARSNC